MRFMGQLTEGDREDRKPKVVAVVELAGEIVEGETSEAGGAAISPRATPARFSTS